VIAQGLAAYDSLAHVAEVGFASAVRLAGSALHMIATAYSAGCYGCNGITATGIRAGFGIIAVDPNVIPLGTRLFIPGYGRAIAGDTGGAIVGHRIDLGFDSDSEAMRWGSRPVTVYVLR
jgi:3D (Asp-Asp-Asp) domain-containing protein